MGLNKDGTLNEDVLRSDVGQRSAATLQSQTRLALQELPFSQNWFGRLKKRMADDPVYADAGRYFSAHPVWGGQDAGYGMHEANAMMAHSHVRQNIREHDGGYHVPTSAHWVKFKEAYYVLEEERRELSRLAGDSAATSRLQGIARFTVTNEIRNAYQVFADEHKATTKAVQFKQQKSELLEIAKQEQLNVLQPMIYEDSALGKTMGMNHAISRYTGGFLSPRYAVVYSAKSQTDDPGLQTVFDKPDGAWDYVTGPKKNLPNPEGRMSYVGRIADNFNDLMANRRSYMEGELRKIQGWMNA
ncbi:hypothetical protein [Aquabacterium sp.]|uniref:DUF2515 family protein n=1 Tax=Aquabacterium sp. TaxID=1872578 RepID=UPI0019987B76|nr:hypothetical protein [Aquabacterium sp.]MBC7701642.1 hypothetical protein [Aquabacterium sp.]